MNYMNYIHAVCNGRVSGCGHNSALPTSSDDRKAAHNYK